ncbi:MAG: signal recognition particle protein [Dehalococcoidia bacterium]|nr:signal recognition particle protein [Dehalococcoidia bacterium]
MFEALSDKLTSVFSRFQNKGRITEKDLEDGLKEVRLALLEADVNFRVTRKFIDDVKARSIGKDVLESISPGQQIIKIVHEEMTSILGTESSTLSGGNQTPNVLMLVGLQGSGKTTTAAKLSLNLKRSGNKVMMIAADLRRPAAIDQLETLGKQLDISVYSDRSETDPIKLVQNGIAKAKHVEATWVLVDTGGRLHIDSELMRELQDIKKSLNPSETLMVVDSMTGQDAISSAQGFHDSIELTGLIMTKLDGDARGGAALSISQMTNLPIKFIGTGEKTDALEAFHPERMASRILGMGDVLTLVERAQEAFDHKQMQNLEQKMRKSALTLEDFLQQIQQIQKMGSVGQILDMVPGFSSISRKLSTEDADGKGLKKVEAIIYSMTPAERNRPDIIKGSRRRRIATGSGTTPYDVNQLLNQFKQMQRMMKQISSGKIPRNLAGLFR